MRKNLSDGVLSAAARYFADFLSRSDKYGHTADGRRHDERARQHGYEYCVVLENIGYQYHSAGFSTAELAHKFLQGWERSPGHRQNMLNPDVVDIGVAIARNDRTGYYFAVQMFGLPWSAAIEFSIGNGAASDISYALGERSFALSPGETRTHRVCGSAGFIIQWPDAREAHDGLTSQRRSVLDRARWIRKAVVEEKLRNSAGVVMPAAVKARPGETSELASLSLPFYSAVLLCSPLIHQDTL